MQIRPVRPAELAEVGRLTAEVYVGESYVASGADYVARLVDTAERARQAEVWVAVEGTGLLGSVTFCPAGSPLREIARADEGEFRMLAVSAAARGRGVGRALVEVCLQRADELGYAGTRISSMDRMTSAHSLYERLGFVRVPADDWSPVPGVGLLAYLRRTDA